MRRGGRGGVEAEGLGGRKCHHRTGEGHVCDLIDNIVSLNENYCICSMWYIAAVLHIVASCIASSRV